MGAGSIGALGGLDRAGPEVAGLYRSLLGELAAPEFEILDDKTVQRIKKAHRKRAKTEAGERPGTNCRKSP
jgi:hypothetical protein